jgi:hypothetical protein
MISKDESFSLFTVFIVVELTRDTGELLTVNIDGAGNILSVVDDTGYALGEQELGEQERISLKTLVGVD